MTTTTDATKVEAKRWARIWRGEARLADAAGEWKKARRCEENARVWEERAR